jgi:hypothetical protein
MRERAAIATGAGDQALGPRALRPRFDGQEETVPASFISNSLEFEGIKTRVVNLLPDAKEEHCVLVFQPLFDEGAAALEIPHHVGERNIVAVLLGDDCDGRALNCNSGRFGFAHGG